jgi:FkbM family methyltransferase
MQDYYPENFYHHHGLRFIADPATLNYIKDKDILDIGAFIGDSLVVLRNYTSGRVISYELAPGSYQKALKWASNNSLVFNMGISDAPGTVRVRFKGGHGSNLNQRGVVPDPVTTVHDEVERLGVHVGMIKADVENFELNVLKGAWRTRQKDRPVLSIALYHGLEILDLPKIIDKLGFYELRYFFGSPRFLPFFEFTLFAVLHNLTVI